MNSSMWKRMMTNNQRFSPEHPEYRQVYLLNVVLVSLFFFCLFFAAVNLFVFSIVFGAVVNAAASASAVLILLYFHKTDHTKGSTIITVLIMFLTLAAFLAVVEQQYYALYWIAVFPPVSYFLLGRRNARIVTSIFCAYMLLFIMVSFKSWAPAAFNSGSIFNIVFATVVLILLISYFELSRKEAAVASEQKNEQLKLTNNELKENKDQLRLILDSTAEGIFGIDLEDKCTFCNSSCIKLLGYSNQNELLGKNMHMQIHHSAKDGTPISLEECKLHKTYTEGIGTHSDDEVFWRADGTCFDVEYHSYPQFCHGILLGAVVTFNNNTQRKLHEEQIKYLSNHDSLTGLYNRRCFEEKLNVIDSKCNLPISIIFGDINGLKLTNDVFGHSTGDELILKTAAILKKTCKADDIIARVGGDEFVILLPNTKAGDAERIISRIKSELARERISAIKCSMSMGSNTKIDMSQSIEQTMENAENEMYKEKTLNRKSINSEIINTIIATLYAKCTREEHHSLNVGELCQMIGRAMKLSETKIKKFRDAGFLHDIGKIVLSDYILNNNCLLIEKEKKDIQQHPIVGYRILNLFDNTLDLAEGVYCHHENWDGSGYPKGLKGKEIPILARVLAVAEVYDTLTNDFIKNPMSKEEALQKMNMLSGTKLDPEITGMFVNMMSSSKDYI